MAVYEVFSPEETRATAKKICASLKRGDVACLSGDLGVGKTVFAKGFAEAMNITEEITSPTFTIVNEYKNEIPLYHFDVYRIEDEDAMEDIGCEDYFYGDGICLVEWAELIRGLIPPDSLWITIEKNLEKGTDYRKITVERK